MQRPVLVGVLTIGDLVSIIIPSGYAQVTFIMRGPSATKNSTWSLGFGFADQTEAEDAVSDIYIAVTDTGAPMEAESMVVGWQALGLDMTYVDGTGPHLFSHRETITGVKSGSPLPVNCSFLISKGTNRGGRKGRGRVFFPPAMLGESGVDGMGIIDSGIMATLQGYWDVALANLITSGNSPLLLHSDATVPDVISAMSLQQQLATQRRRMR